MTDSQTMTQHPALDEGQDPTSAVNRVDKADKAKEWSADHAINIRVTIPFFVKSYYVALVAGTERRNPNRRKKEQKKHPILTVLNLSFLGVMIFYIWFYIEVLFDLIAALAK